MHYNKKARVFTMPIVMDPETEGVYVRARNELDMKEARLLNSFPGRVAKAERLGRTADDVANEDLETLKPLLEAKEAAEAALDAATAHFKFRALGRKLYRELVNSHPPTAKQIEDAKAAGEEPPAVDHDTFSRALIAAASVDPVLSREQVDEIFDSPEWNTAELALLYSAANAPQNDVGQRAVQQDNN